MKIKDIARSVLRPVYYFQLDIRKKAYSIIQRSFAKRVLKNTYADEVDFFESISNAKYTDNKFVCKDILRRVHQVDKVLLFKKRFDKSSTIKGYEICKENFKPTMASDVIVSKWADDILEEYYADDRGCGDAPIVDDNSPVILDRLIKTRRSIRSYTSDKVSEEDLDKILTAGLWAPSGCNRQNIEYLVIDKEEDVMFCQKLAGEGNAFPREAAMNIVILVDPRALALPAQRHCSYLEAGAAIQNMLLTAHSLGLGMCWLFWSKIDLAFNERFCLPRWLLPVAMVTLGQVKQYPKVIPVRKELSDSIYDKRAEVNV
ncbi:MAG: nitroreductase family protein [Phycisphaerae bacterium]